MNIETSLNQNISLSPKMQQSLAILQLNSHELLEYINRIADENPVIEIEEQSQEAERFDILKRKLEWLESANESSRIYNTSIEDTDEDNDITKYLSDDNGEDLYENLKSQLKLMSVPEKIRKIVNYMIECINENGYFEESLNNISHTLKIDNTVAEEALFVLQSMEPAGIGARDLRECLLLQLERQNKKNTVAFELVHNYLEMLGKNRLEVIAKELGLSIDKVRDANKIIRSLNPRPGSGFGFKRGTQYLTADIIIVKFSDYYEVILNDYFMPKITISNVYQDILKHNNEKDVQQYISGKIKEADWIINCISQRNSTLLKVTSMIVKQQKKFFDNGPKFLTALNQKYVANELGVHESTVSRAIKGKYLHCLWGLFSLDYFFTNSISSGSESEIITDNIKLEIKRIIENEDKKKPYSDQKIADILKRSGIDVARRTVTKYREGLNIQSTTMRKEY